MGHVIKYYVISIVTYFYALIPDLQLLDIFVVIEMVAVLLHSLML